MAKTKEYILSCDSEIIQKGTKKELLAYFNGLENPMPMQLIRVIWSKELVKRPKSLKMKMPELKPENSI